MKRKFRLIVMYVCIIISSISNLYAQNDSAVKVLWGYKGNIGPERWSQLSPNFVICAKGKSQSPINFIKKTSPGDDNLRIFYSPAPLNIMNDGITTLLIGREQTLINDGHTLQVNFASHVKEFITIGGREYHLVEFHLHTPGEHQWYGQSFPVEIHFVHQSSDGRLAVIGVFAKGGSENSELLKMLDHLPTAKGRDIEVPGVSIDPSKLLPFNRDYFSYAGSLTTPPCSEGVQWLVMNNPISMSPSQIVTLRKAISGSNARPVQRLNGRQIFYVSPKLTQTAKQKSRH